MLVGYTNAKKVREYFSNTRKEKTIAEMMRERLDKNIDISIFLDFIYKKIEYYTSQKYNYFEYVKNICDGYKNKTIDKYIKIDSNERDHNYSFEVYLELEPTPYEHQKIIEQLTEDGFKINKIQWRKDIFGEMCYKNKISW